MKEYDINTQVRRIGTRAEIIANWYMRFNGFFVVPNFILHDAGLDKQPGGQLSEADLMAMRMPYEHEVIKGDGFEFSVPSHSILKLSNKMDFVIAEISSNDCKFNWLEKETGVINLNYITYALRRFGWWKDTDQISEILSKEKTFEMKNEKTNTLERITLISFGSKLNPELNGIIQITFQNVLQYFKEELFASYGRSDKLKNVISDHKQWDKLICQVYNRLLGHKTHEHSVEEVLCWLFPDVTDAQKRKLKIYGECPVLGSRKG